MDDLTLKRKLEDMVRYGYACLRQFPRAERLGLAADIKRSMFEAIRLTITTNKRYHKKTTLRDLDVEIEMLKSLVRLAMQLGFLPFKHYEAWQRMNVEIGRMVGGWLRAQHADHPRTG